MADIEEIEEMNLNEWNLKTTYKVAFQDMIQQRTTMMKFLLENYGIDAMEKFFLEDNPAWAEELKVGRIKKAIVKALSHLAPKQIMNKVADMIIEQAQYLVPLEKIDYVKTDEKNMKIVRVKKCPVRREFRKTLKKLNFNDMSESWICSFACVPVLAQYCQVGNISLLQEYDESIKGCYLKLFLEKKVDGELMKEGAKEPVPAEDGRK
ncbi:MAG: hypothetical protein GF329_20315 [Candidatus Lokiarchaeota archaeon]|nr:hypothetical protein [Candidatus Lokiarchaeota archaeon]